MAVVKTIQTDNPSIRAKSEEVTGLTSAETKKIIQDLTDTMRHENLVGMAAPQIGYSLRIFVTEIRNTKYRQASDDKLRVFINPKITKYSKKSISGYEGCGSVESSNFFGPVKRPEKVTVTATDEQGREFVLKSSGVLRLCADSCRKHNLP